MANIRLEQLQTVHEHLAGIKIDDALPSTLYLKNYISLYQGDTPVIPWNDMNAFAVSAKLRDFFEKRELAKSSSDTDQGTDEAVMNNIKEILLTFKVISEGSLSKDEQQKFSKLLTIHPALSTLSLTSESITDTHIAFIADKLCASKNIIELDLYRNRIGSLGIESLAHAIQKNDSITKLNLSSNNIGDAGCKALAKLIEGCPTLRSLNLADNDIGDSGVKILAHALMRHHEIKHLFLTNNKIGDAGAHALAMLIHYSQRYESLHLYSNQVKQTGASAVARLLKDNVTLTDFQCDAIINPSGEDIWTKRIPGSLQSSISLRSSKFLTFSEHYTANHFQQDLNFNASTFMIQPQTLFPVSFSNVQATFFLPIFHGLVKKAEWIGNNVTLFLDGEGIQSLLNDKGNELISTCKEVTTSKWSTKNPFIVSLSNQDDPADQQQAKKPLISAKKVLSVE